MLTFRHSLIILFVMQTCLAKSQFLYVYKELVRADSAISYLIDIDRNWVFDYKSYDLSSKNENRDSTIIYSIGKKVPAFIRLENIKYFRDNRPYIFSAFILSFDSNDTLAYVTAKVSTEKDSFIEYYISNFDTLIGYEQYYYDEKYRDFTSYITLYPTKDTMFYRTIEFKNNLAFNLHQYDTIIDVNPRIWYNSYTERYLYSNSLIDSIIRTQYHEDGSIWVTFTEKYFRDKDNKLYYVEYYIYDSTLATSDLYGYIHVFGAPSPNHVKDINSNPKSSSKIFSVADKIKWDQDLILDNKSLVLLYSIDGRPIRALSIDTYSQSCSWPPAIPAGFYLIQIRNKNQHISATIMKDH